MDHIPLTTTIVLDSVIEAVIRRSITRGSDAEKAFIDNLRKGVPAIVLGTLNTAADIDWVAQALADMFSSAWDKHSHKVCITKCLQPWWDNECTRFLSQYKLEKSHESWLLFWRAVKAAKHKFFDLRIDEIAGSNKRPWDLMEWVKQHKLPACEAIQYNGQPCHQMSKLWDVLHNTYNLASGREVDLSVLDPLPTLQERDWPPFSALELTDALSSCSSRSSPGPDHIMWVHLKAVLENKKSIQLLVTLADACICVGHWPKHFQDSVSVIIPKPGKPTHSTPKLFRPIVLLNTVGKLIEKMISNHLQFNMIKYDLVHPNQVGGV